MPFWNLAIVIAGCVFAACGYIVLTVWLLTHSLRTLKVLGWTLVALAFSVGIGMYIAAW